MKRLPVMQEDRKFLKAIEGDPAMVLLLMLRIYPTPINADNLTFEMKWDQRKSRARKVLDDLSSDGFTLLVKGEGYVLTSPAIRRITEFFAPIVLQQLDGHNALAQGNKAQALNPAHDAGTEEDPTAAVLVIEDESQLKISTQNARALKKIEEEEESLILKPESSSSPSSESTQNAQPTITNPGQSLKAGESMVVSDVIGYTFEDGTPVYQIEWIDGNSIITTREVLEATEVIEGFGDLAHGLPVDAIKPDLALAWIAKAYDDRNKLRHPTAALVYSRLKDIDKPRPPRKYFKDPAHYLPDEYAERLRLEKYDCKSCVDKKFSTQAAFDAHVQEMHPVKMEEPPTEFLVEGLPPEHPGAKAWLLVKIELQMEMPRASFETWVRDTQPITLEENQLTVAVRNAYCRDW